jgi:two-component system chemotaxis response regulator CheY
MSKTVMIVDDSPTMLMSIEGILSKVGLAVLKANSGEDALARLEKPPKPDLIITGLNMGKLDGIELIRTLRRQSPFRFVPILMLTTESEQEKRNLARSAGATGWIVKPVDPAGLIQVVKKILPGA